MERERREGEGKGKGGRGKGEGREREMEMRELARKGEVDSRESRIGEREGAMRVT